MNRFPVWKKVEIGLHRDLAAFRAALEHGGNRISSHAGQILKRTPLAATRSTVELFRVTRRELGLPRRYTFTRLLAAASKQSLGKLPAEVGLALREAYTDQPMNECVGVVMDPIAGSGDDLNIFNVGRDDIGPWLRACCVSPASQLVHGSVWVFSYEPSKR